MILTICILIFLFIRYFKLPFKNILISPSVQTCLFILFYCYLGTELYWKNHNYVYLGRDYSPYLDITYYYLGLFILVFFLTETILYSVIKIKITNIIVNTSPINFFDFINIYTLVILIISLIFLPYFNQLGILQFFFNSLIPIIGFCVLNRNKKFYLYFAIFLFITIMAGFRFRILLLFLPIIYVNFIEYKTFSKKFLLSIIMFFLLVLLLGIISHFRSYGSGVDFSAYLLAKSSLFTLIISGIFVDTSTVLVTGYFIDSFDFMNFSYFNQIFYIIKYFIPSFFFIEKTYSPVLGYIRDITDTSSGSAILSIGDYYHTGGAFAVVLFAFFFSSIFTYLFKKQYLLNISFYLFSYSTYIIWLINHYTRGYLPQGFADLISLVLGLYLIKRQYLKKY